MARTAIALSVAGVLVGGASAEQASNRRLVPHGPRTSGRIVCPRPGVLRGSRSGDAGDVPSLLCQAASMPAGAVAVAWPARFTLTRPRLLRGDRLFTRLSIHATGSILRGAAKYVDPVMRYEAKFRMTEGNSPCVWQWVDVQYADAGSWCPG